MPEAEARSWWADVEHLREPLERRRAARTAREAPNPSGRRTVTIRGHAVPGAPTRALRAVPDSHLEELRPPAVGRRPYRRPPPRALERIGSRPDRIAAWAVVIVLLVALVAALSAHA